MRNIPDACGRDDKALNDFFTPITEAGEQVVKQTVATFKVFCGFAVKVVAEEEKKNQNQG